MKRNGIWAIVSVLVALGLILGACAKAPVPAAPAAPTAPAAPAAEKPAPPKLIKWVGQIGAIAPPLDRFPSLPVNANLYWSEMVEKMFPGRIKIDWAPANSIVPENEMMVAVGKGTLDTVGAYGAYHTSIVPEATVEMGLPFAWADMAEAYDAFYNFGFDDYMNEVYGERNIWATHYSANFLQGMGGYTFLANSLEDLKGKKIRAVGIWQKWYRDVGANAVMVTYSEMYMALKLGTIQGILLSVPALDTIKAKEVLKSWVVYPNSAVYGTNQLFNQDSLNALPDDIRTFIEIETKNINALYGITRTSNEQWWRVNSAVKDGYIEAIRWSEEEATKARQIGYALWDEVAALSPRTARGVEIIRKQQRDYGRMK